MHFFIIRHGFSAMLERCFTVSCVCVCFEVGIRVSMCILVKLVVHKRRTLYHPVVAAHSQFIFIPDAVAMCLFVCVCACVDATQVIVVRSIP